MTEKPNKRVAFLCYLSDMFAMQIYSGVINALESRTEWEVVPLDNAQSSREARIYYSNGVKWDGVLAAIENVTILRQIREAGIPTVSLSMGLPPEGVPSVMPDLNCIGRMAAEHLLGLHLRHFGYLHSHPRPVLIESYKEGLRQAHFEDVVELNALNHPESENQLQSLPRPMGILCVRDQDARALIIKLLALGYDVPRDFSVLGVGNNPLHCGGHPSLSSIEVPLEKIGLEAARLLKQIMLGDATESVMLNPKRLIQRQSTSFFGVEDEVVRCALEYIVTHIGQDLTVPQIAAVVGMPQHMLERRFQQILRHPIRKEILRLKLRHAQQLLITSDLSIQEVSIRTGYERVTSFMRMFKLETGLSPGAYRAQHKRS